MIRGFVTGVLAVVIALAIYLTFHLGLLKSVEINQVSRGPLYLLYRDHRGAYFKISEVIAQVETLAKQNKLSCLQTFGEYFDNPSEVDEDRLRSRGGCISETPYNQAPGDLQIATMPEGKYVVAKFDGSPAVGPWKVYPKVQEYVQNQRLKMKRESFEIYTLNNDSIATEYLFPME
jgi:DNA gyrase inhibitor GyrI